MAKSRSMKRSRGPSGQRDQMRNAIIGFVLVVLVLSLLGYFFGGSSGSVMTMHTQQQQQAQQQPQSAMAPLVAQRSSTAQFDVTVPDPQKTAATPFDLQSTGGVDCGAEVIGCMDASKKNFNPKATRESGQCQPIHTGCTDPRALSYNPHSNTPYQGSCWYAQPKSGCTDPMALNTTPGAVVDDGSCVPRIFGCVSPYSAEYDPESNTQDPNKQCAPFMLGCSNEQAKNYSPDATVDSNGCWFAKEGCAMPSAPNFDINASVNVPGACCTGSGCAGVPQSRPLAPGLQAPCSDCN